MYELLHATVQSYWGLMMRQVLYETSAVLVSILISQSRRFLPTPFRNGLHWTSNDPLSKKCVVVGKNRRIG